MVILPSGLTFVATPRTGSRAISEALLRKHEDAISDYPQDHHMWPESVPQDYTIYTVIRNPVDQMISWWNHVDVRAKSKRRVVQFAKEYSNVMFLPADGKYRLNIYGEIADIFMPYDSKLQIVAKTLKLDDLQVVGKSKVKVTKAERIELSNYLNHAFAPDVELWNKSQWRNRSQ